jgi:hypothetical protein
MGLPMMEMKICIHNPYRITFYYPHGDKTFLDECTTKALSHLRATADQGIALATLIRSNAIV